MTEEKYNYQLLLTKVLDVRKRYEADWQRTGEKYNIFKVAKIDHKERNICRVLADLLNPHGKHGQGTSYLRLFCIKISQKLKPLLDLYFEKTKVTIDDGTDENRLIDITLEDDRIFVPMEVKIDAQDLPKQLADYYAEAQKRNSIKGNNVKDIPVLYLTKFGSDPDKKSIEGITKNNYIKLSFKDDIITWLIKCWKNTPKTTVTVRENLRQLIATIESFCGKTEDAEMDDEIFKLITKNDDSVRAALAIRSVADFDKKVLEAFKGPVQELVKKEVPVEDQGIYLRIPIKDGKYYFAVNYLWSFAYVQTLPFDQSKHDNSAEGKELYKKMSENFIVQADPVKGYAWYSEGIVWQDFDRNDTLHLYKLWKLYTKNPEKVADKIVNIVRAL